MGLASLSGAIPVQNLAGMGGMQVLPIGGPGGAQLIQAAPQTQQISE